MNHRVLLIVATIVTAGLVFGGPPQAGSQEESTGTFRDVERNWRTLAALAEPGGAQDVKITVHWNRGGLSVHWLEYQRGKIKGPIKPRPAEETAKILTPSERDRFLEGLKPQRALRNVTNSASKAEVGASGVGIVAIAHIEISKGGEEVATLGLDLTGLSARGGTGQGIYSGYLAEFLDELALDHVGSHLPPSVIEVVSGEAFVRASRSACRVDQYEKESNEKM